MKPHTLITLLATALAPVSLAETKDPKSTITIIVEKDGQKEVRTLQLDADAPLQILTDMLQKLGNGHGGPPAAPTKKITYLGVTLEDKTEVGGFAFLGGEEGGGALFGGGGAAADPTTPAAPGLAPGTGLTVTGVTDDSPAAKAGLQAGDVLARLNDQTLVNPQQFTTLIRNMKEGDVVRLSFVRNTETKELDVTLASREETPAPTGLGFLQQLPELGRVFTLDPQGRLSRSGPIPLGLPAPSAPGTPAPTDPSRETTDASPSWQPTRPLPSNIEKVLRDASEAKEKWQDQLSKWREEWSKGQQQAADQYRQAVEAMKKELDHARAEADRARQDALKAVEDIRLEFEKSKSESAPPAPPQAPAPQTEDAPKKA